MSLTKFICVNANFNVNICTFRKLFILKNVNSSRILKNIQVKNSSFDKTHMSNIGANANFYLIAFAFTFQCG